MPRRILITTATAINRLILRLWPHALGKMYIWQRIDWRTEKYPLEFVAKTRWGGRFYCWLHDLIQSRIYYTGVWEPSLTEFLRTRLSPGDVFVDVGANIGYYTVLASKLVGPTGRVISIEASPRIFALLQRNLALNGVTNVRAVNVAASGAHGTLEIYAAHDTNSGATSVLASRGGTLEARVEAHPVVDVLTDSELAAARMIKIDVEGYEGPVLVHLLEHAERLHPEVSIVVELSPEALEQSGTSAAELLSRFRQLGFECWELHNDYTLRGWYDTSPRPPVRLEGVPQRQVDVVLTRVPRPRA